MDRRDFSYIKEMASRGYCKYRAVRVESVDRFCQNRVDRLRQLKSTKSIELAKNWRADRSLSMTRSISVSNRNGLAAGLCQDPPGELTAFPKLPIAGFIGWGPRERERREGEELRQGGTKGEEGKENKGR